MTEDPNDPEQTHEPSAEAQDSSVEKVTEENKNEAETLQTRKFENRFSSANEGIERSDNNKEHSGAASDIGEMVDREERKRIEEEKAQKVRDESGETGEEVEEKPSSKSGNMLSGLGLSKRKSKSAKSDSVEEDKIGAALKKGRMVGVNKKKRKKYILIGALLISPFLLYKFYVFLFAYPMADKTFSICRTYLELKLRYPKHIDYIGMQPYRESIRVWYTRIDPFGARRLEQMRCYFKVDERTGQLLLSRVSIERREERFDDVASFNKALPVLMPTMPIYEAPRFKGDKNTNNITVERGTINLQ